MEQISLFLWLKLRCITANKCAEALGVSKSDMQKWVLKPGDMPADLFSKLCNFIQVNPDNVAL